MLVLSRKENQAIMIDDSVRIIVTEIRGKRVKMGIEAPVDVGIRRCEVCSTHRYEAATPGENKPL